MLFTVIPSELYWRDLTLRQLLGTLVDDLTSLCQSGIEAKASDIKFCYIDRDKETAFA